MKKRNIKGFTLIELLAVIIIMGILMMTAIPAVTKYIENSRKDTFWQTAKSYIDAARTSLLNGEFEVKNSAFSGIVAGDECDLPPVATVDSTAKTIKFYYTLIDIKDVEMEKGKGKSSFNRAFGSTEGQGYIIVANRGYSLSGGNPDPNMTYYFIGVDAGKNGIDTMTNESSLGRSKVKKGNGSLTAINNFKNNTTATGANLKTVAGANISGYTVTYNLYTYCVSK